MSIGRDEAGRFAPGYSPDRGRGPAPAVDTAIFNQAVRDVANREVTVVRADGRKRRITFFEAQLLLLATGQSSRRSSPIAFINLVLSAAERAPPPEALPVADPEVLLAMRDKIFGMVARGDEAGALEYVAAIRASRAMS